MARFATAGYIVGRAAQELGLAAVRLDDPFGSQDVAISQLCGLIASCGQELAKLTWAHLIREWTFTVQAEDTGAYRLPSDFQKTIPDTGYNRSALLPLGGPVQPAGWQALRAQVGTVSIQALYRLVPPSVLRFAPGYSPAVGSEIAIEYQSRNWVTPGDKAPQDYDFLPISAGTDAPEKSADVILFDSLLMIKALKLAFRKARRFDTTVEQTEYDDALQTEQGLQPSSAVSVYGGSDREPRMIGFDNVPARVG